MSRAKVRGDDPKLSGREMDNLRAVYRQWAARNGEPEPPLRRKSPGFSGREKVVKNRQTTQKANEKPMKQGISLGGGRTNLGTRVSKMNTRPKTGRKRKVEGNP